MSKSAGRYDDYQTVLFALHSLRFLNTREKLLLADIIGTKADFQGLTKERLSILTGRRLRIQGLDCGKILQAGEETSGFLHTRNIRWVHYWDEKYPPLLREIYNPPFLLFYKGSMPVPDSPCVGAVGTRRPTGKALKAAYVLGLELGLNGIPTVSGLARGIDQAVHRGTVDCGGKSIAVLGCGIDRIYPGEHKKLAEKIIETGGAVISEYPPGTPPLRYNFPERNRIVSGLSRSVIVLQSPEKSGALITAEFALEQGRDLLIHADGLDGLAGKGGRKLKEEGAPVMESAADVVKEWSGSFDFRYAALPRGNDGEENTQSAGAGLADKLEKELQGTGYSRFGEFRTGEPQRGMDHA